jgi:hypothetical protein
MDKRNFTRAMIDTAVDRGINQMEENPKRTIRKLADLGKTFSTGEFSQWNFTQIQKMLKNENSPYYTVLQHLLRHTAHDNIKNFGINVGYDSWIYGARIIRKKTQDNGFAIPWMPIFNYNSQNDLSVMSSYERIINEASDLGINSFCFIQEDDNEADSKLLELTSKYPRSAFFYFLPNAKVSVSFTAKLKRCGNTLLSINVDSEDCSDVCAALRTSGCLYSIHYVYHHTELNNVNYEAKLEEIYQNESSMLFLIQGDDCNSSLSDFVVEKRLNQTYPIFLWDLYSDIETISQMICGHKSFLKFDSDGKVVSPDGYTYNIFEDKESLLQILSHISSVKVG